MNPPATTGELLTDEKFGMPRSTIRFTAGRDETRYSSLYPTYFIRVSVLFLIICFFYYFNAYVRRRPVREPMMAQAEPAEDPAAKTAEAKMNAALAARWRQEAFDKSGAEEEARKAAAERAARKAAEFAKPWRRHRGKGDDSPLHWAAGSATRRGFT